MAPPPGVLEYAYTFVFPDGTTKQFVVRLDAERLEILREEPAREPPAWTELTYKQCQNCPLDPSRHRRCPVAANIVDLVEFFRDFRSYDEVEVRVRGRDREYVKKTALQNGVSPLLGIYMVSSGCPVMNKLRPMVATHLPFMTSEESSYRMLSMYLMAQWFIRQEGGTPDWSLTRFVEMMGECQRTNSAFCGRLRSLGIQDASLNALGILNSLGEITSLSVETQDLDRWRKLFLEHYR